MLSFILRFVIGVFAGIAIMCMLQINKINQ